MKMRTHLLLLVVALATMFALGSVTWPAANAQAQEQPKPISGDAPPTLPPSNAGGGATRVPGDELKVTILTFGPGTHPFYKFGHNAIWIQDLSKKPPQRDKVYNWGMFTFGDPALLPKFVLGRFMYWMEPQSYGGTIYAYKREGRSVDAQELDLPPEMKLEMVRLLEENAKEENKFYKYDYYRDNCSTRVRDMIDKVTGGRVKAVSGGPGRLTYREQTLRLTADLPAEYVALNLVMGDLIDKPRTVWEESFIPMEFQKVLRGVTLVRPDGTEYPIVREERNILAATRPPPPENPPTTWYYSLLAGVGLAGLLALFGRFSKKPAARIALGLLTSFFGLLWGFFGLFFLAAWAFTDHEVGYGNENTLLCVPWAIVLVGSGLGCAFGQAKSAQFALKLVRAALISTVVATAVKVLPWFDQANFFFLVFFLPFWGGLFYALRELTLNLAPTLPAVAATPAVVGSTQEEAAHAELPED
jgi:hypothetical protein